MKNRLRIRRLAFQTVCLTFTQLLLSVLLIGVTYAYEGNAQELLKQRISLRADEQTVKSVLSKIEKLTSVKFLYSPKLIKSERKVSINSVNEPLGIILEALLKPLQITYEISGRQVVLSQQVSSSLLEKKDIVPNTLTPIEQTVSGTITDIKGEALAGVSVLVKGTNRGTSTNGAGKYTIVAESSETLVFSFVGYLKKRGSGSESNRNQSFPQ